MHSLSDTTLIDHLVMREFVSGDLTGGSPSTSVTVYTKHVQRRLDGGIAVNVCDRIHEACAYDV